MGSIAGKKRKWKKKVSDRPGSNRGNEAQRDR